jgi:hypothetical protein
MATLQNSRPKDNGANSWRVRTRSHYHRILEFLGQRGERGVLSSELYDNPALFGRSPRNRVSEMRRNGFDIETIHVNASVVRYVLHNAQSRATEKPRPALVHDKPGEWRDRPRVTRLPLFDAVRS